DPGAARVLPGRARHRDRGRRPGAGFPCAHQRRRGRRAGRRAPRASAAGGLMPLLYTRYELLRTLRNRRFFVLSLGFPLLLYYLIATPNRHLRGDANRGISAPL